VIGLDTCSVDCTLSRIGFETYSADSTLSRIGFETCSADSTLSMMLIDSVDIFDGEFEIGA
jgi:hypothetical protein